jgi:hypothetical protein
MLVNASDDVPSAESVMYPIFKKLAETLDSES